jgi:hypothetical protein
MDGLELTQFPELGEELVAEFADERNVDIEPGVLRLRLRLHGASRAGSLNCRV